MLCDTNMQCTHHTPGSEMIGGFIVPKKKSFKIKYDEDKYIFFFLLFWVTVGDYRELMTESSHSFK